MAAIAGQIVGATVAVPFGISRFANELCERAGIPKSIILDLSIGWNTLVLFLLFICACVMSGTVKYYTDPPAVGDGIDVLWSVDQGDAFSIVFPPLAIIFFNLVAIVAINFSWCNDMRYGMYVGISMAFIVQILQMLVQWGSNAVMLEDLSKNEDLSLAIGYPAGSFPTVKLSAIQTSQAIVVFSSMMLIFQTIQTVLLLIFKDAIVMEGGLCGDNAQKSGATSDPFGNGGGGGGFVAQQNSDDL